MWMLDARHAEWLFRGNLVEYVEVEEKGSIHKLYRDLTHNGMPFQGERWFGSLQRIDSITIGEEGHDESGSMNDEFEFRATFQNCTDSGHPNGLVISAASPSWVPVPPLHVFNFLGNERTRSQNSSIVFDPFFLTQWTVLFNQNPIQEVAHIANDSHPGNSFSVLRVNEVHLMVDM
ncbi:hypothetical protein P3L10_026446 [Capsicum annuum]